MLSMKMVGVVLSLQIKSTRILVVDVAGGGGGGGGGGELLIFHCQNILFSLPLGHNNI